MAILESGRIHPPGLASQNLIHVEARDARDALWAMEEGVRCAGALGRDRRNLGRPARRSTSPRRGGWRWRRSAVGYALLAGAARRHSRISAARGCAGGSRARRRSPIRSTRARRERRRGMRTCSARAGMPPGRWSIAHEAGLLPSGLPHLAIERWARTQRLQRLTRRSSSPSRARTGRSSMPSPRPRPNAARGAGARLTDARALDPALLAIPADPAGDAALVERLAQLGRALVAAGRGRRTTGCGSTSAASRICSAASADWCDDIRASLRADGPDRACRDCADRGGGLGARASCTRHLR